MSFRCLSRAFHTIADMLLMFAACTRIDFSTFAIGAFAITINRITVMILMISSESPLIARTANMGCSMAVGNHLPLLLLSIALLL